MWFIKIPNLVVPSNKISEKNTVTSKISVSKKKSFFRRYELHEEIIDQVHVKKIIPHSK